MVISGDDGLTLPILCLGGSGVISVAANVEPALMVKMFDHFCEGELEEALDLHYALSPLFRGLFIDTNPIPLRRRSHCVVWQGARYDHHLMTWMLKRLQNSRRSSISMPSVVVCGALGRMGMTIGRMVNESADLDLVGGH